MPTFYKPNTRKNNKTFIVRGYINEKQREFATNSRNKRGAQAAWDKLKADLSNTEKIGPYTFSDAVRLYEEIEERSKTQMDLVHRVEDRIGDLLLEAIKPSDVKKLAREMSPKSKASTRNRNVIGTTQAVINCAAEAEWVSYIKIKKFQEDPIIKQHPTAGAGELLMANCMGYKRLYIAALIYHGLRPSDALSLQGENIDMREKKFTLVVPKSNAIKVILMDERFWLELTKVKLNKGKIFPWANRSSIATWLKPLEKKLNVEFGARKMRHQFASDIAAVGGTEHDIVSVGSWTSTRSVKNYVTLDEVRARDIITKKQTRNLREKQGEAQGGELKKG
jgi:integrase